jgi:CubicO group peptidase (beta-lactamase class C family)
MHKVSTPIRTNEENGYVTANGAEGDGLSRSPLSAVGVAASGVLAFLDDVDSNELDLHALLIERNGELCIEAYRWPYNGDRPRSWHSIAKAFTSTAIGFALSEKYFRLTDKVVDFFPEHLPPVVDDNLAAMTVRDLLTMRTGHAEETSGSRWRGIKTSWVAEFLKIPVTHRPGDVYIYTSAASYMLSAILTKSTGLLLHEYLRPRLFEPLGISGETWDIGPDGINPGGNGFICKTTDLLKFGMLHLQKGIWNGKRILPEAWICEATRPVGDRGYGFHWVTGPEGEFFAMGLFGQLIAVLPSHDAVVIMASALNRPDACSGMLVPLLHKHLHNIFPMALPDKAAEVELDLRIANMSKPTELQSVRLALVPTGLRRYALEENTAGITQIGLEFEVDRCVVRMSYREGEKQILVGVDRWIEGETNIPGAQLHHGYNLIPAKVIAGARWLSEDRLEMTWMFVEMTFTDTVLCDFHENRISVSRSVNVNSGDLQLPVLHGELIK